MSASGFWGNKALSDLTVIDRPISYGIVQTGPHIYDGIPCVRVVDISSNTVRDNKLIRTSETIHNQYKRTQLRIGDLLFALRGKIGELAIVEKNLVGGNLTRGVALIALKSGYYPRFYLQFLSSDETKKRLERSLNGSALQEITIDTLRKFEVPTPPPQEQKAIAKALSDTDALIAALEKLIEKKRAIKTATMQQLLTGKTRLPGFGEGKGYKDSELGRIPEDWEVFQISNLLSNIIDYRGVTPLKLGMNWGGGGILALSAGNVKDGYIDFEADAYFGSENLYQRWMRNGDCSKGDILVTLEAPLGNVAQVPDNKRYILSQRTILLQPRANLTSKDYLFHYLRSDRFRRQLFSQATGSTAQGIQRKKFESLYVSIPSLEEQVAIAKVLSSFNSGVNVLAKQIEKMRIVKTAMMQQLLTGRTRLI